MKKNILLVIVTALAYIASAQGNHYDFSATSGGKTLYYRIDGSNAVVTYPKNTGGTNYYVGHSKPTGNLIIPGSVTHSGTTYTVTAIDDHAFFSCNNLSSVAIASTITTIGDSAFMSCSNLTSVDFGNAVESIGFASFRGCNHLPHVCLPASVAYINNYAFFGCSSLKKFSVHRLTPPSVTGNTLTADTLEIHCTAMGSYHYTSPWSTRFATVVGFPEDLPRTYDTVTAFCSYEWNGELIYEGIDSISYVGAQSWACDTLHVLTLTIENVSFDTVDTLMLCYSMMPYTFGDTVLDVNIESGDYTILMHSQGGCDSTVALHLTVHASEQTELCMVSVDNGHNVVMWNKDMEVAEYNIYREGATTGNYEHVATIPYDSVSIWVDETSRPITRSYRYRITSTDMCGIESDESAVHKTMHLTINKGQGSSWNLIWTEYEGASYSGYQIYRGYTADDIELIDELPADGISSYTDPYTEQDTVYYQVAIVKDEPCFPTKSATLIRSNIATNGTLGISEVGSARSNIRVYVEDGRIHVSLDGQAIDEFRVYDIMGREVFHATHTDKTPSLQGGLYLVKVDNYPANKLVVIR